MEKTPQVSELPLLVSPTAPSESPPNVLSSYHLHATRPSMAGPTPANHQKKEKSRNAVTKRRKERPNLTIPRGLAVPGDCPWRNFGCSQRQQLLPALSNNGRCYHSEKCPFRPEGDKYRDDMQLVHGRHLWDTLMDHCLAAGDVAPLEILRRHALNLRAIGESTFPESPGAKALDEPFLFSMEEWWKGERPSMDLMGPHLFRDINTQLGHEYSGILFRQMSSHSQHSPAEAVRALNIDEPASFRSHFPLERPVWCTKANTKATWNVTAKYCYVDLHMDEGAAVTAYPVGGRKIWLLISPEAHVDERMPSPTGALSPTGAPSPTQAEDQKGILAQTRRLLRQRTVHDIWLQSRIVPKRPMPDPPMPVPEPAETPADTASFQVAPGNSTAATKTENTRSTPKTVFAQMQPHLTNSRIRIACTDSTDGRALYLPPGWLHVVYTLESGFLGGFTLRTKPEAILEAAICIIAALHRNWSRAQGTTVVDEILGSASDPGMIGKAARAIEAAERDAEEKAKMQRSGSKRKVEVSQPSEKVVGLTKELYDIIRMFPKETQDKLRKGDVRVISKYSNEILEPRKRARV
ncbi:hypothetical protein K440DRAFT_309462 [Wilcoxina mikolae CBS 423.85]|nr:hypothetical protein K440DRAFT_309462 [Wilcoxina mikolae CBS 423.85]